MLRWQREWKKVLDLYLNEVAGMSSRTLQVCFLKGEMSWKMKRNSLQSNMDGSLFFSSYWPSFSSSWDGQWLIEIRKRVSVALMTEYKHRRALLLGSCVPILSPSFSFSLPPSAPPPADTPSYINLKYLSLHWSRQNADLCHAHFPFTCLSLLRLHYRKMYLLL